MGEMGGSHKRLTVMKKGKSACDTRPWGTEHGDDNMRERISLTGVWTCSCGRRAI